jgi:hypothetical protein
MPWAFRNKGHFGELILFSNNLGVNLYIGYHQDAPGLYHEGELYKSLIDKKLTEVETDRIFQEQAVNWIKANRIKSILLYFKKVGYLLLRDRQTVYQSFSSPNPSFTIPQRILAIGNNLYYLVFLGGFFLSVFRFYKKRDYQWLHLPMVVFTFLLFHALFFASDRFSYPSSPFVFLLAGIFFHQSYITNHPSI